MKLDYLQILRARGPMGGRVHRHLLVVGGAVGSVVNVAAVLVVVDMVVVVVVVVFLFLLLSVQTFFRNCLELLIAGNISCGLEQRHSGKKCNQLPVSFLAKKVLFGILEAFVKLLLCG